MSEPPVPLAPPTASYASRGGITFLGILLMLTFMIPMSVTFSGDKTHIVWSWDVLKDYSSLPDAGRAMMNFHIAAWGIGLLCVIFAAAMRNLPLAICYVLLAGAGIVVTSLAAKGQLDLRQLTATSELSSSHVKGISPRAQAILFLSLLGAFLLITGLRSRVVRAKLLCILQIPISLGLAGWVGLVAWDGVDALRRMPAATNSPQWWVAVFVVGMMGLLVLAGVIAFFHGMAMSSPYGGTTRGARRLAILALLCMIGIVPALILVESAKVAGGKALLGALPMLGAVFILLSYVLLSLEAVTALLASILGFVWPPPLESMPAGAAMGPGANQLSERLQRLDYLRSQGAISAEEYASQRKRLLNQL